MIQRNKKINLFCGLSLLLLLCAASHAETGVKDLVAKMPGKDTREGLALIAQMVASDKPGVFEICGMLVEPGKGDDAKARRALQGMAFYVARPGAEGSRAMFEGALLEALEAGPPVEIKAFLFRLLQLAGKDASVPYLARYLGDDRLCEPAVQALFSIGSPEAGAALAAALPVSKGKHTVTLVQVLGRLEERSCVPWLIKLSEAGESAVRRAAWYALAEIGDPDAYEALEAASRSEDPADRAAGTDCLLEWVVRVAAAGTPDEREQGLQVCRSLLRSQQGSQQDSRVICKALAALTDAWGAAAMVDLLAAVSHKDRKVRMAALYLARELPGEEVTRQWVEKRKSVSPEVNGEILYMLARRGDPAALREEALALRASMPDAPSPFVEEDFVPLFNGKDLTGWTGDTQGYFVEEGRMVCGGPGRKGPGNLYTEREFSDFILRFDFKLTPGANNGLGIRMAVGTPAAYDAMELQILDNTAEKYQKLQPYQYHGSVYGVAPAKRGYLKPVGEWNEQEVIAKGRRITVTLNGTVIVDVDLDEAVKEGIMDGRAHPGLKRTQGRIAFLGHGDCLEFRNIRIKEL